METTPSSGGEVKDPLGHIKLAAGEFARSAEFYRELLGRLGDKQISDKKKRAGWATPDGFGIWVAQAEVVDHPYQFSAPGLHHLCLKAESSEQVDEVHQMLTQKGTHIFDPPQSYPEYTEDYYAVFFADPDGIKLEVAYY